MNGYDYREEEAMEALQRETSPEAFIRHYREGLNWRFPECCVMAFASDGTATYGWARPNQCDGRGFVACDKHDKLPRIKRGLRTIVMEARRGYPCHGFRALLYAIVDALPR